MRQVGDNPAGTLESPFPSTVHIGGLEKRQLLQALHDHQVELNEAAHELFRDGRFKTLRESMNIKIARLSVADLGFAGGATYEQLAERAGKLGFVECPLELGPHLRLQFLDQVEGAVGFPATKHKAPPGSITVASCPLDESDATPKGFYLRRIEGVPWLRGYRSGPDHIWSPGDVFVFARPAPTLFERLSGAEGVLRLAQAWHECVLADEVVAHAFRHGFHPQHTERLAAYWGEAWGGPPTYSERYGTESSVVRMHSGNGHHEEMDRRAIACFDKAMDLIRLTHPDLRRALHDYFTWATTTTMAAYPHDADHVPDNLRIPRWSWDGLQT